MKRFSDLTEQEILALAVASEEEDSRIYRDFAEGLRANYPASAKVFDEMAEEETQHRHMLLELHRKKFGEHLPLIRRQDVRGFISRRPVWLLRPLGLDKVRKVTEEMEFEAARFYAKAAERSTDTSIRKLLGDLAEIERGHESLAARLDETILTTGVRAEEERTRRRMFVLQFVQPGLAGLMDGSVSTLAPLFAAAFATQNSWDAFPGRPCRLRRRRHQHGLRRGAVGRRQPHRPRRAVAARRRVRPDDHDRRHRAHPALSDSGFPRRHLHRHRGRGG